LKTVGVGTITTLLVLIAMLMSVALTVFARPAAQAPTVVLAIAEDPSGISNVTIDPAITSQATFAIDAQGTTSVAGIQFDLEYDPTVLDLISATGGALPSGFYFEANTNVAGTINVIVAGSTAAAVSSMNIAVIEFNLVGGEGESSALTLANLAVSDAVLAPIAAGVTNGSVTLSSTPPTPTPSPTSVPAPPGGGGGGGGAPSPTATPTPAPTPTPVPGVIELLALAVVPTIVAPGETVVITFIASEIGGGQVTAAPVVIEVDGEQGKCSS
jgi:hypothetical protein